MKLLRANIWWNAVVPQVLGWVYFVWLAEPSLNHQHIERFAFFFVSLLSISAFGYVLNDYYDIESDRVSGKKNSLSDSGISAGIILVPLIIGLVAWAFLPIRTGATVLFALQIVALFFYSAPPLRLKQRAAWGVLADAFYGHINPVFITLTTFIISYTCGGLEGLAFFSLVFICTLLKGVRNILLHQLDDRKKDSKGGINTFVVKNGALFSLNLINKLLPAEAFFTFCLAIAISVAFPPFFLSILLFTVFTYLKFSGWKLAYLPKRQLKFKFLYFLNDYYEGWVPVFFLILLSVQNHNFLFILVAHLILFPAFITKLKSDFKTIRQNFKTEDDY